MYFTKHSPMSLSFFIIHLSTQFVKIVLCCFVLPKTFSGLFRESLELRNERRVAYGVAP